MSKWTPDRTQRTLFGKRVRNIIKRRKISKEHNLPKLERVDLERLVYKFENSKIS